MVRDLSIERPGRPRRRVRPASAIWALAGLAVALALASLQPGPAKATTVATRGTAAQPHSAPAKPHSAAAAATPRCKTAGLVIWLRTPAGNGAAGSIYYKLAFTNLSGHACTLSGYPGVSAVSLEGRQLGHAAARERTKKPRLVKLAPGATATATLRIVEAGNFPSSRCGRTTAAGLRVYPPGQSRAKVVPFPFEACKRSSATYLSVQAVR